MLVKVKVFPNSKKEEIVRKSEDGFEIRMKEKPIRGRANKRVVEILSSFLKAPKGRIKLIKGSHGRNKIFEITKN